MRKFFSTDSFAIKALSWFCDWMFLNLLFLIFSIPIFTMGASATAVYAVIFKKLRGEDPPIFKTFVKEFKSDFKKATQFFVPFILVLGFLVFDVYATHNFLSEELSFLQYPAAILAFLILCGSVFVFPQIAVFDSPLKAVIKNSVLLAISNIPTVIFVIVTHVVLILLAGLSPKMTFIILSIMLFFGFGFLAFFFSLFYRRIFAKYIKSDENDNPITDEEIESGNEEAE